MCEGLLFDADFHFLLPSSLLLVNLSWQSNLSKSYPQHGGRGRSEMLAFSQKMKTTACQVDTNSRLAEMRDQEKAYEPKNFVVCVQK